MQISALILAIAGLCLWVGAYLNWDHFMNPNQLSFATSLFGGREQASMVYGLVGCTLFVLGTLALFGLVTIQ
jgi:hypothetical protein